MFVKFFKQNFSVFDTFSKYGQEYLLKPLKDFCNLHNINLHYTSPRNSNSYSPVERLDYSDFENIRVLKLLIGNTSIKQILPLKF